MTIANVFASVFIKFSVSSFTINFPLSQKYSLEDTISSCGLNKRWHPNLYVNDPVGYILYSIGKEGISKNGQSIFWHYNCIIFIN